MDARDGTLSNDSMKSGFLIVIALLNSKGWLRASTSLFIKSNLDHSELLSAIRPFLTLAFKAVRNFFLACLRVNWLSEINHSLIK